jgi:hypothetical protein
LAASLPLRPVQLPLSLFGLFPRPLQLLPKHGQDPTLIPLKDILEAQGESQETLDLIIEGETIRQHMGKIFGPRTPKKPPEPVESVQ